MKQTRSRDQWLTVMYTVMNHRFINEKIIYQQGECKIILNGSAPHSSESEVYFSRDSFLFQAATVKSLILNAHMPVFIINQQLYFHHIMQFYLLLLELHFFFFFWPTVTSESVTRCLIYTSQVPILHLFK